MLKPCWVNAFSWRAPLRRVLLIVGVLVALDGSAGAECSIAPPLKSSNAVSPYRNQEAYARSTRDMRAFITMLATAADSPGRDIEKCATDNLNAWAKAGALTQKPDDFEGERQLIRYAFALNIITGKLLGRHAELDRNVIGWLQRVTTETAVSFGRRLPQRKTADNLYVWSGAAAASYLLLVNDGTLDRYQRNVWLQAINAIEPDGRIVLELARKEHALNYHAYYLSALLWLREMRRALGIEPSEQDAAAISRLERRILAVYCSSDRMIEGQPMRQNPPNRLSVEALPTLEPRFFEEMQACGLNVDAAPPALLGGSVDSTKNYISARRQH